VETLLPDSYRGIGTEELKGRIRAMRDRLGKRLVVLTHHYQRQEIVDLGDFRGDSYGLSLEASRQENAEFIVFCGVHFMAESAAILARQGQMVFHPDFTAGCPMADMADVNDVERAYEELGKVINTTNLIPLTYMNSDARLKAFCGKRGGAVVTSSNSQAGFKWAFERAEKIFFFPDEHLGRNTADKRGIPQNELVLWNPAEEMGGNEPEDYRKARVILWKGFCHVHTHFTPEHVRKVREEHPGVRVIVHPECVREVVKLADADGSTEFIVNYVKNASPGSVIAIGTEINLVERLARAHPDKKVFPLSRSLCPNMFKISLNNLCHTLENLPNVNRVIVEEPTRSEALAALKRMLEIKTISAD